MEDILVFAKEHHDSFQILGASSNEVRSFEYGGKKYVIKTPLMRGDNLSPFWQMMNNLFDFSFEEQNSHFEKVYDLLKCNPHIPVVPFVAGDEKAIIFEYVQGDSVEGDDFPVGSDNAYKLGLYVGYNHQRNYDSCGLIGNNKVSDFYSRAISYIDNVITKFWNGEDESDRIVRNCFAHLKDRNYKSERYAPIMVDICADQFMYNGEDLTFCVDLDAYVIGPVEWELSFLHNQVKDWESFCRGYEKYQPVPEFGSMEKFFYLLMALSSYDDKAAIYKFWAKYL